MTGENPDLDLTLEEAKALMAEGEPVEIVAPPDENGNPHTASFDHCMSGVRRWYGWLYTFHCWGPSGRNVTVWLPLPESWRDRVVDWWMECG